MDGARLSRFPYCSWIGTPLRAPPSEDERAFHLHAVVHALHLTVRGTHATRWMHQGREVRWQAHAGQVHFLPADDLDHELLAHSPAGYESFLLFLPRRHVQAIARVEGIRSEIHPQRLLREDDRLLQACLLRLAAATTAAGGGPDGSQEEAARRLVLRIVELCGGGPPDWHDDRSTFGRRVLADLVDHIDAHLRAGPTLEELSQLVGLSPSHFARKFRQTTGLSLQRFINRRRLRRSIGMLTEAATSIETIAAELGFASQSHFTRTFSQLTGSTPARFRREHGRGPAPTNCR